jgi:hypothetical protein
VDWVDGMDVADITTIPAWSRGIKKQTGAKKSSPASKKRSRLIWRRKVYLLRKEHHNQE